MAGQVGHAVGVVEPADLAAHPAVVLVMLRLAQDPAQADNAGVLVQDQVARLHHREEGKNRGLVVLALHVAQVLVVLVDCVLHDACGDARVQEAQMLDVERHLLLPVPCRQEVLDVMVRAQEPRTAARIAHLAPLAHELAGIPVDPLAGLLVQVEADAVDIGGDFRFAVTLRAAHEGREGIPDFLPLHVRNNRFEVARPGKVFDAAADRRLVIRCPGRKLMEHERIPQGLGHGIRGLLVNVLHETAQPLQVVPDGPVEFGGAVTDDSVVRHALVQLVRQFQRRFQPGGSLGHPGTLDLQRFDLMGQRQRLQEEQLNRQLLGRAGGIGKVLPEVGHHRRLGVRHAPLQPLQQLRGGCSGPRLGPSVQR
ncbi:hypothetical protein D9M72_290110 [compost metagenome]